MIRGVKYNKYVKEEKMSMKASLMFSGILVEAVSRIGQGVRESKQNLWVQK